MRCSASPSRARSSPTLSSSSPTSRPGTSTRRPARRCSSLRSFEESVTSLTGTASLTVLGGRTGFPASTLDAVRKVDGVAHAVGMIEMTAYFDAKDGSAKTLTVLGIDLLNEASIRSYKASNQDVIDDPLVFVNQTDSIIVTTTFAAENKLALEDQLVRRAGAASCN